MWSAPRGSIDMGSLNTRGPWEMVISPFMTKETRHDKCYVDFKDLIIIAS